MVDARQFIDVYEKYYFKKGISEELGIKGFKTTKEEDENVIVNKLKKAEHDQNIIAWKMGSYSIDKEIHGNKIIGRCIFDMTKYLEQINNKRTEIDERIEKIKEKMKQCVNYIEMTNDLADLFRIIRDCRNTDDDNNNNKKFGTVYIINSMFFLSKGAIPIYDRNAYKAVQALYLKRNPKDIVYNDPSPAMNELEATFRLIEYMWLLDRVFGKNKTEQSSKYINCEHVGYISRGLDRALWVYGQCKEECDKKMYS